MSKPPYRSLALDRAPWSDRARAVAEEDACPDGDLVPIFFLVWIGSVVRVSLALPEVSGPPFTIGTETTLAGIAVIGMPYLARRAIGWWAKRRWLQLTAALLLRSARKTKRRSGRHDRRQAKLDSI